jgi:MoaA/NifB/PqqE/SkfB family radical SAM enzyme
LRFYGKGKAAQVSLDDLCETVDRLGIPLDGASDAVISQFRTGRNDLLANGLAVIDRAKSFGVEVCVNTVIHRHNTNNVKELAQVVKDSGADRWQIFEFQPTGPIAFGNAARFELNPGEFDEVIRDALQEFEAPNLSVQPKSRAARQKAYFMVDDSGMAWQPGVEGPTRETFGHITRDRDVVLGSLEQHLRDFGKSTSPKLETGFGSVDRHI